MRPRVGGWAALVVLAGAAASAAPRGERVAYAQVTPSAQDLLGAIAGTPPVACDLVVRDLGNRWGTGLARPRVHEPLGPSASERALADWAGTRTLKAADVEALVRGLASADPCVRRVAASLLARADDPAVEARLRERVAQASGTERLAAITALAEGNEPASEAVLRGLLTGEPIDVRRAAAWALGRMEASSSIASLSAALDDADEGLRENAAWALGRIERPEAVADLTDALRDVAPGVRVNAAWALGQIEDPAAIPSLASLLSSDADAEVRTAAAWALSRLR